MLKQTCWIFVNLVTALCAFAQLPATPSTEIKPQVATLTIDLGTVTVLRLRPGYVTSVRLPEDVSSIVVGDPKTFKAEHSDGEPRLVFLKPMGSKPSQTNALVTTKSGHEVSLHLISSGQFETGDVDFLLNYQLPRSFLVPETRTNFTVSETVSVDSNDSHGTPKDDSSSAALFRQSRAAELDWHGKQLQIAVGRITQDGLRMIVPFSVINNSANTVDLLPPQIQLSGPAKTHGSKVKAEPVPIESYTLPTRKLSAGARADGVVVFERPSFKESSEQLLLQIAESAQVDHPVLAPISFTATAGGRN